MVSGAAAKYPTMTLEELKALPLTNIAQDNCVLAMWATAPLLVDAIELMKTWGFTYKTFFTWVKEGRIGMGFWFRGNVELLLVGVRGKVPPFRLAVRNHYASRPSIHSRKPEYISYDLMEMASNKIGFTDRVEIFARKAREGWDAIGLDLNGQRIENVLGPSPEKDKGEIYYDLKRIAESVESHYEFPVVAPNGKAEGLCLAVRGLKAIIKKLDTSKRNL
jgi:N6-adenosine-specific RNA methylase IME4